MSFSILCSGNFARVIRRGSAWMYLLHIFREAKKFALQDGEIVIFYRLKNKNVANTSLFFNFLHSLASEIFFIIDVGMVKTTHIWRKDPWSAVGHK